MFADSDDYLLPNILNASYEAAKKDNYDIILFSILRKRIKGSYYRYNAFRGKKPIFQPELSSFMYYGNGLLKQIDFHLFGKLIKKEVFINAINSISDYYLKNHMSVNEDGVMNFMLLKKANSLIYLEIYGYMYVSNVKSVIFNLRKHINKSIRDYILYLKFMFEYTDNNWYEKAMAEEQLKYVYYKFKKQIIKVTENFQFFYDTLNLYLNCTYISEESKKKVEKMIENFRIAEKRQKI